jgi:ADP-ribosyl-[dinitrogen reductase] hydrolase
LTKSERRRGALFGAAIGDALGVTYEFLPPDHIPAGRFAMVGGGPFGFEPGAPSDDTDLLLCVLRAYHSRDTFSRVTLVSGALRWMRSCPPDIGVTTRNSLHLLSKGVHPPEDPDAQGNGGLMRAAAHALACDKRVLATRNAQGDTRLTHNSYTAAECSSLLVHAVYSLIDGETLTDSTGACAYEEAQTEMGGHCLHTLRLALWAVRNADSFEDGIDRVIRTGGDTDTNACVAGALLGARFGIDEIPADWLDGLSRPNRDRLEKEAQRLDM